MQAEGVEIGVENGDWDVEQVLENGQRIALEQYNSVFHSESQHPNHVFKIFYRTSADDIKKNIAGADTSCFPESEVVTADLSDYDFEENSTVVVQTQSDYSAVDAPDNFHSVDQVYRDAVNLMDKMVSRGMINSSQGNLSELKLEEFHYFGRDLKYVDFEDSNAFRKFPDDYRPQELDTARHDIGRNYSQLAHDLSDEFGDDLERVKGIVGERSDHLDYENHEELASSVVDYPFQ